MDQHVFTFVTPTVAAALVGVGLCGVVAVVSPRTFSAMSKFARRRIETNRWFAWLDKEVDVDEYFLRHTRLFGLLMIAATLCVMWLLI
jgi:hypothetical protein